MSFLIDSDWLIDAQIGEPSAVNLLAQLRDDGLAVSDWTPAGRGSDWYPKLDYGA